MPVVDEAGLQVFGSMLEVTPEGRVSVRRTAVASPAPSLVMVTVKPTAAPALTVEVSAVLVTCRSGGFSVREVIGVLSCVLALGSLVALTVAVLARVVLASGAVPVMCTEMLPLAAR